MELTPFKTLLLALTVSVLTVVISEGAQYLWHKLKKRKP